MSLQFERVNEWNLMQGADSTEIDSRPYFKHFDYTFWENTLFGEDLLRQKIAYALSQILVISYQSDLDGRGHGLANFYDIFILCKL